MVGVALLAGAAGMAPRPVVGQAPASAPRAELSRDTVALGDAFELRIAFEVPRGRTAYFPDTIPGTEGVESVRPVEWSVDPAPGASSTRLALVYPLIALRDGTAALPEITIFTGPSEESGASVGAWAAIGGSDGSIDPALTAHVVTMPELRVESVLALRDDDALLPRPPDDVVGPSWSLGALVATLLFGGALAVVLGATGLDWLRARSRHAAVSRTDPLEEARRAALAALDELPALGLIEAGHVEAFYARTSGAVRAYAEHFDPAWSSALTSTELVRALERRSNGTAAPDLRREMAVAETVKFGRLRPDAREAEAHRRVLRAWVAEGAGVS